MCGMYDSIKIGEDVNLPHYPEEWSRDLGWQTKDLMRGLRTYKVTANGLLRKEKSFRERTQEEKNEMARERTNGVADTWDEWEEMDTPLDEPFPNWKRTVDEEWWVDHNQHGSVKFYTSGRAHDFLDGLLEYEARFTKGELDEIVLLSDEELLD